MYILYLRTFVKVNADKKIKLEMDYEDEFEDEEESIDDTDEDEDFVPSLQELQVQDMDMEIEKEEMELELQEEKVELKGETEIKKWKKKSWKSRYLFIVKHLKILYLWKLNENVIIFMLQSFCFVVDYI